MNAKTPLELLSFAITGHYVARPRGLATAMLDTCAQELGTVVHALNPDSHGACIPDADALHSQILTIARRMETASLVAHLLEHGKVTIDGYGDEDGKAHRAVVVAEAVKPTTSSTVTAPRGARVARRRRAT